jgi:hypothetical protein
MRLTFSFCRLLTQLTPKAMKGCIQFGKRLHHLEDTVLKEDIAAMGKDKFG